MTTRPTALQSRIPELDGIRGIAILSVIIYHYFILEDAARLLSRLPVLWRLTPVWNAFHTFGKFGWAGVDLFFVLSGFLIGGILLETRSAANYFKVFYARRAHRILPLYLAVCLIAALIWLSGATAGTATHAWLFEERIPWYAYLTFAQNLWMAHLNAFSSRIIDATWSLAIEEQFYLVLPLVVWFLRERILPYFLIAGIVFAFCMRLVLLHNADPAVRGPIIYLSSLCRMDALLYGVMGAWWLRQPDGVTFLSRHRLVVTILAILFMAGVVWMVSQHWGFETYGLVSVGLSWISLAFLACLLLAVTQPNSLLSRFLRSRWLGAVGALAYALYLLHQPVLGLTHLAFRRATPELTDVSALLVTLFCLALVFLLARLSWVFFEGPLVQRGHTFRYEFGGSRSALAVHRDVRVPQ